MAPRHTGPAAHPSSAFSDVPDSDAPAPLNAFTAGMMPKNLTPVVHADSETAPRTYEGLEATLRTWWSATIESVRGTPQYEQLTPAMFGHVISTRMSSTPSGTTTPCARPPPILLPCTTPSDTVTITGPPI